MFSIFKKHNRPVGQRGWVEFNMHRAFITENHRPAHRSVWQMSDLNWTKAGFYHGQPVLDYRTIPLIRLNLLRIDVKDHDFQWTGIYLFRRWDTEHRDRHGIGQITDRFGLDRILWAVGAWNTVGLVGVGMFMIFIWVLLSSVVK